MTTKLKNLFYKDLIYIIYYSFFVLSNVLKRELDSLYIEISICIFKENFRIFVPTNEFLK